MEADINSMMVFLAVVEAGSFTLAAERLGMPKANVSRKLSKLEQQLGVTLLERSTRAQHLTEAGKRYLIHCKRISEEVGLATAAVSEILHTYKGSIKVGTSVTVGQQIIGPVLSKFLRQYPDIKVELSLLNQRVDLIEEGFDVLIRVGELDDSRLIGKYLGTAQQKLYASPKYLSNKEGLDSMDALEDHDTLFMANLSRDNKMEFVSGSQIKAIKFTPKLLVDDFSIIKNAAIDGEGIAILPEHMCRGDLERGTLINVLPQWRTHDMSMYALYPKYKKSIPKVRAFIDFIAEVFEQKLP